MIVRLYVIVTIWDPKFESLTLESSDTQSADPRQRDHEPPFSHSCFRRVFLFNLLLVSFSPAVQSDVHEGAIVVKKKKD